MQRNLPGLRATRANPPGMASAEGIRRETYGAALQQFDDLMAAAAAIGPVSRPLPLYYAVHQAGKAIAAAWSDEEPPITGHGLTEDRPKNNADEAAQPAWHDDVLRFRVRPHRGDPGVFAAVADALGTTRLTDSAELGALWSALPGAALPPDYRHWPVALPVQPVYFDRGPNFAISVHRGNVYLRGQAAPGNTASIMQMLAAYPDAADARVEPGTVKEPENPTDDWGTGVSVAWSQPSPELIPPYPHDSAGRHQPMNWLVPAVGGGSDRLTPLLTWWVLLYGLSVLARYQPAEWQKALNLDRSPCADGLMELLDEALTTVPGLLYEAAILGSGPMTADGTATPAPG